MAHMVQHPIPKMEISDNCVCTQHLVGGGEVRIFLIEAGPYGSIVAERV
jgi:hypothetical protein